MAKYSDDFKINGSKRVSRRLLSKSTLFKGCSHRLLTNWKEFEFVDSLYSFKLEVHPIHLSILNETKS